MSESESESGVEASCACDVRRGVKRGTKEEKSLSFSPVTRKEECFSRNAFVVFVRFSGNFYGKYTLSLPRAYCTRVAEKSVHDEEKAIVAEEHTVLVMKKK